MSEIADLALSTIDQMFADWGRSVVLEEVKQDYDPESGRLEGSVFTTTVRAVVCADRPRDRTEASALVPLNRKTFLFRQADLPQQVPLTSARLRLNGELFAVRSVANSSLAGVLAVEAVTQGPDAPLRTC